MKFFLTPEEVKGRLVKGVQIGILVYLVVMGGIFLTILALLQ